MKLRENIDVCSVCKNRKIDMNVGLVCGLTNEIPEFEGQCDTFLEDSEAVLEREKKKLTLEESKKELSGVTCYFLYITVGLGLLLSSIMTCSLMVMLGPFSPFSILLLIILLMFGYVGVSAIIAFHKHQSNAVALALTYLAMSALGAIYGLLRGKTGILDILNLILPVLFSLYFIFSEDIRFKYPREFRTWNTPEKVILGVYAGMVLLMTFLWIIISIQ